MDRHYSKDQILWYYLNEIPYGPTTYGIEAASQSYFNKPAKELTLAESALLAAIPRNPIYYDPGGSHIQDLLKRKDLVLKKMLEQKKISDTDYKKNVKFLNKYLSHGNLIEWLRTVDMQSFPTPIA